jgi:hypothetical protein
MHEKLNRAVKAYDKLLEERLSSASQPAYERPNINNSNINGSYAPYYGSYNPGQQQQLNPTYPTVAQNYNNYSTPSPLPQTPALQQNYVYPTNNYIQQQQPVQQTPVIQNQQVVQQTPAVQHQPYTAPISNLTSTTPSYQPQYGIQPHTPQTIPTPIAPVVQQNTSDAYNQQYSYPSVPTTVPTANNRYYENTGNQQPQYNAYYNTSITPQGNAPPQQNNQKQPEEEVLLIEL